MNVEERVLAVLDQVLGLGGRAATFTLDTRLLGAVPEFDSMAVVSLIAALEDQFGIAIDDEDIDGDVFSTIGSLVDFVTQRVAA
jgi:acyl carrier protein